ncbi:zinc finger protein 587-like [Ambystoma mexicanum]|uniref:zinc finger protein 587-like n=1 Tax=Ambystoma mexicanum TaxID=8296 RepID=UPI0037E8329B
MSRQDWEKVSITFCDVAACFSEEEWKLLHEWQKDLYSNVMKEIQQALTSLGPLIATNIFSLKAKNKQDMLNDNPQDPGTRQQRDCSPNSQFGHSDVHFRIHMDENQHLKDQPAKHRKKRKDNFGKGVSCTENILEMQQNVQTSCLQSHASEGGGSGSGLSSGHELKILTTASNIKEEEKMAYPMLSVHPGKIQDIHCPTALPFLAPEQEVLFREGRKTSTILNTGLHPGVSFYIKDEGKSCSMEHQDSLRNEGFSDVVDTSMPVNSNKQQLGFLEESPGSNEYSTTMSHKLDENDYQQIKLSEAYACPEYDNSVNQRSKPAHHKRSLTRKMPYSWTEYDGSTNESVARSQLQKMQTGLELFICSQCGNCFNQSQKDITLQQGNSDEQNNTCSQCANILNLSNQQPSDQGEYLDERPYKCCECGKSFRKAQTLMIHRRVHTGEKPYPCSKCGKNFRQLAHLVKHERMHMGEKPYICNICERRFIDSSHLKRHQQIHNRVSTIRQPRRMQTIKWTV